MCALVKIIFASNTAPFRSSSASERGAKPRKNSADEAATRAVLEARCNIARMRTLPRVEAEGAEEDRPVSDTARFKPALNCCSELSLPSSDLWGRARSEG